MAAKNKYSTFWRGLLPEIKEALDLCKIHGKSQQIQFDKKSFEDRGDRKRSGYSFNIQYSSLYKRRAARVVIL